jgi:hypothetical protein
MFARSPIDRGEPAVVRGWLSGKKLAAVGRLFVLDALIRSKDWVSFSSLGKQER